MTPDYSTLNLEALRKLPTYKLPDSYHLQTDPGNGCFGDPPGYPSYFTRSVYTKHGNGPRKGAETVITYEGVHYVVAHSDDWGKGQSWDDVHAKRMARLHRLYKPLPVNHPRVQAWILSTMKHHQRCYADVNQTVKPFESGRPATLIYPLDSITSGLRVFHDDPRFSDEWRAKEQAAIEQHNAELRAKYREVCTVDNHSGVRIVRKFYPEWNPTPPLLSGDALSLVNPGDWWQRHATRPTAEECAADPSGRRDYLRHRSGWCQFCGHVSEEPSANA